MTKKLNSTPVAETQAPPAFVLGANDFGLVTHGDATITLLTQNPDQALSQKQKALVAAAMRIENEPVFIQELSAWHKFYMQVPEGQG